jgi:hypothetical protein
MSAYNPDGVQKFKTVNAGNYTPEQLKVIEYEYKRHIHSGKDVKDFRIIDVLLAFKLNEVKKEAPPPPPPEKHPNREIGEPFERKDLSCLKIPENQNCSFAFIGSTRSGKTYAMKHVWNQIFKKHITILMTHSGHAEIYRDFKKSVCLSDGFHKELIDEGMKINKATKDEYHFCYIFDDLGMDGKMSDAMTSLLTRGRNIGCSCLYAGQKLNMLSATGRSNINYILCFAQNTDSEIENTIKTFLRSYFPKGMRIPEMVALYRTLTQDHHFICVDTLDNQIFIGKI